MVQLVIIAFHHCHFDNVHILSTMFIFLIFGLMLSSNDNYLLVPVIYFIRYFDTQNI